MDVGCFSDPFVGLDDIPTFSKIDAETLAVVFFVPAGVEVQDGRHDGQSLTPFMSQNYDGMSAVVMVGNGTLASDSKFDLQITVEIANEQYVCVDANGQMSCQVKT